MVSAAKAPRRAGKKRRTSARSTQKKSETNKRLSSLPDVIVPNDSLAGRFCLILELGCASIWEYVSSEDVNSLLQTFAGVFSEDFVDKVSLKAIQSFAVENKTHLGRQCGCDWMRSLDFVPRSDDMCTDYGSPYSLDESLPILQVPGGARSFLNALVLIKNLKKHLRTKRFGAATFVPVVCPLVTKEKLNLPVCTEDNVKRVMNRICHGTGSRYFHTFERKRGTALLDYLDYHWDGIDGVHVECNYCDNLTYSKRKFQDHTLRKFKELRSNCKEVYRPLKAAMMENLQFVRFVPPPRGLRYLRSTLDPRQYYGPYEGLVAGITKDGVLCGVYMVRGFKPSY
ncbi:hypothetical protein PI124_g22115 [Phytophthora idaei]|nr:hypothetical protein PI125_g16814 [Phytophthora idaei]KAG3140571.1 hypothetical protein PI126_g15943 [Phytophthora idaei]KAG3232810.1 hypothetical protein PI124_g22115 [Phytophthora idaei]